MLLPRKKKASQDYLYYNADAPLEYFEMELEDASRAGKPATRSSSSTDDGEPPSKKPKPRFNAHGKNTAVENALETALADFVRSVAQLCSGPGPRPRGDGAWVVAAPRHGLRRGHRDGLRPLHVRVHGLRSGLLVALGECHGAEVRVLR